MTAGLFSGGDQPDNTDTRRVRAVALDASHAEIARRQFFSAALCRRRAAAHAPRRNSMGPSDSRDGSPSSQKRALKRPNHRAFAICGGMLLGLLCVAALQHWHGAGDDLGTPRDTLARRVRGGKVRGKSARRRLQKPSLRLGPAAVNDTAGVLFRFALLSDTHYWQPTAARAKWAQTADARAARDGQLVADSPTTSEAALRQLGAFAAGGGAFAVHLGDTMCGGSNFGQPRDECAPRNFWRNSLGAIFRAIRRAIL